MSASDLVIRPAEASAITEIARQKLGGRVASAYIDPGPLWRSRNQIIVWDDLQALL